jgi:SWIM zinc finger
MLTREKIESMAPDQASLGAALKLLKPASWPVLAADASGEFLWGECQGSGSTPYRVVVSPGDVGYKCTCPSRKFPCKHVLAVLWMRVDKPEQFEASAAPPWVEEWSARRRPGSGRPRPNPEADTGAPKPAPSLDAALTGETEAAKPVDPQAAENAAARAAQQRERLSAERAAAVLAGLDELDLWIVDQLNQGMAGFAQRAQAAARTLIQRLVDAKAGGLALRLDMLVAELFRVPEAQRADLAIERLAALTLLASAYRHRDSLPSVLVEDARRAIGWSVKREDLLADATARRVASSWIVAANVSAVQPDKLRRLETWLINANAVDTGPDDNPRLAVLIDYVPVAGGGAGFPFQPGETVAGEVVFYPSSVPLRGLLATRQPDAPSATWPRGPDGLGAAMDDYARRLGQLPWLDPCPLLASGLSLKLAADSMLVISDGTERLPIERSQTDALLPLVGLEDICALFLWDGRLARLLAIDTPIGRWHER